jgi:hypothetical protein
MKIILLILIVIFVFRSMVYYKNRKELKRQLKDAEEYAIVMNNMNKKLKQENEILKKMVSGYAEILRKEAPGFKNDKKLF